MVEEIRIYVEGGGLGADSRAAIRRAFGEFLRELREAARGKRIRWHIVACGGRDSAFHDFQVALRHHPRAFNVLLVDAEGPVTKTPWAHLEDRDGWKRPGVGDEQCHLMVQTVEAWLIADPDALEAYYDQGFLVKSLPATRNVEAIAKDELAKALEHATRGTQKGRYQKIKHCADLLALISSAKVQARAEHCRRLFAEISSRL